MFEDIIRIEKKWLQFNDENLFTNIYGMCKIEIRGAIESWG